MSPTRHAAVRRIAAGAAIAALALALLVRAADAAEPHRLRVSFTHGLSMRADTWATAKVSVVNPGPAGEFEVVGWDDGSTPRVLCRRAFRMPARSTMTLPLLMRPPVCEGLRFELRQGDRVLASERFRKPVFVSPYDLFVVGVATGERSFGASAPRDRATKIRFHNNITQWDLPERWFGYDLADAVAVAGLPENGITTAQREALRQYVAAGGILVLSPGDTADWLLDDTFDPLNPAEVIGRRMLEDLAPLTDVFGPWPGAPARIPMWEVRPLRGDVLLQAGQSPLAAAAPYGAGEVLFVALDLTHKDIQSWHGLGLFYRRLLSRRDPLNRVGQTQLRTAAPDLLMGLVGARVAGTWLIGLLLATNLALVIGALAWMRRRGRVELGFLIACAVAPVFALGACELGRALGGVSETTVGVIAVARSTAGSTAARVTSLAGVVSPGGVECDMRVPYDATAAFWPVQPEAYVSGDLPMEGAPVSFTDEDVKMLSGIKLPPRWLLPVESVRCDDSFGQVDGVAVPGPKGIAVRVRNRTRQTLRRPFVVCNRSVRAVEDLSPGEEAEVTLDSGAALATPLDFSHELVKDERSLLRHRIVAALLERPFAFQYDNHVRLYAWLDDPARAANVHVKAGNDRADRRAEALWIVDLPWSAGGGGGMLLPKGSLRMTPAEPQTPFYGNGRWRPVLTGLQASIEFRVPTAVRRLAPTRLTLFLSTSGRRMDRSFRLWNRRSEKWDVITMPGDRVDVPDPAAYYDPADGAVKAKVRLAAPADEDLGSTHERLTRIKELDAEIEGRMP